MNRKKQNTTEVSLPRSNKPVLITGGAGFIGTNVAHRLLSAGQRVVLYDNLSRPGVEKNLEWLRKEHGPLVDVVTGDVRDGEKLRKVVRDISRVFHFAAQVAVTTSLDDPIEDFEINARGTLNLLEALRPLSRRPPLIFTSTNKVYGHMADVRLAMRQGRYEPENEQLRQHGFSEQRCLYFHSPYGCSKGCAEQYVLDYAKTFKMPTTVFRMSCIYGPHQHGNEDQGWVAHFLISALEEQPVTIYGDGRQVRDVLFVEDLVDAMFLAQQNIDGLSGEVFNIGGGASKTISLLELLKAIEEMNGSSPEVKFESWRPADQQYYVSDTRKFAAATGWRPQVSVSEGIQRLYEWLKESRQPARPVILDLNALVSRNGHRNGAKRNQSNGKSQLEDIPRSKRLHNLKQSNKVLQPKWQEEGEIQE
jgi:CDP-paratose 2-epimerase